MNFSDFLSSLAQMLTGPLEEAGFKKPEDGLFVRFNESHEINIISIQKHSTKPMVSVNFGVHYDFLPKMSSTELPSAGQIELPDCEVRVRLTPDSSEKDHWWPIVPEAVHEIADLIENKSESFFNRYDIDGGIFAITPNDLSENLPDAIAMLTKVRASLLLARIHEVRGDLGKAADFARFGIKSAGMAVGPKKMLREILKRVEPR